MLGVYGVSRGYFVGVRCIINNPFAAKWHSVSSRRGRFIVPVYTCSPHIRKTLGHICNPFETHLCNVRNVFVICVLHIRRVKVWFLACKKGVFTLQKYGSCFCYAIVCITNNKVCVFRFLYLPLQLKRKLQRHNGRTSHCL